MKVGNRWAVVEHVYGFTEIELDIIRAVSVGRDRYQVAAVVGLSHHTVADHVKSIYKKTKVNHMTAVLLKAERAGLLAGVKV